MKVGLCSAGGGVCAAPGVFGRVAERAEAAGLESLWVSEHLVVADPRTPPSPMDPTDPLLEPVVSLAYAAARTTTLRLGTGVIVLPLRNPLILAKELATLDVLSGGRLIVGVGVGYVEREFEALGIPFARRGERTDRYLDAMLAIWTQDHPGVESELFAFAGVQSYPRPLQRPHPPLVVGGASDAAIRRAVARASGWYGWGFDADGTERVLARLRAISDEVHRDPSLGELEVTITPRGNVDLEAARRFSSLAVDRLNLAVPGAADEREVLAFVDEVGEIAAGVTGDGQRGEVRS